MRGVKISNSKWKVIKLVGKKGTVKLMEMLGGITNRGSKEEGTKIGGSLIICVEIKILLNLSYLKNYNQKNLKTPFGISGLY